jgi:hypothetical protein
MFDLIGQAFISLGTFLQQATTGSTELDSIVSIVIAVAAIAGTIGGIIRSINKDSKIGQYLDTIGQKSVENEEMLYRGMAAVKTAVPEIEEPLKKHGASLEYLKKRTSVGAEQLQVLRDLVLKDKERAKNVDMPREEPVFHS